MSPPRRSHKPSRLHKLHRCSPELQNLIGREFASRIDVTRIIWKYIKARRLQDSSNGLYIYPDRMMVPVVGYGRLKAIQMAKYVGLHLFPVDTVRVPLPEVPLPTWD